MKQGEVGAKTLRKLGEQKIKNNVKKLKRVLELYKKQKLPIIKTKLVEDCGLSIATLNRSPYKEIIKDYLNEEKALLSYNGKQEFKALIKENEKLKEELSILNEKYNRLKKEINYAQYLF